jgi:phosphatidylinositol-3,4,5-trisphosphate 3-phosphatase/dual-specificity protein phosphatase PTEN
MGFPADNVEGVYRNPLISVKKFFDRYHPGCYRLYNLCSEREYDPIKFDNRVARFPFDDHNPPTLKLIVDFCEDVQKFLGEDEKNVVAVHCKAGKGRTGVMICCWLLHNKAHPDSDSALKFYGDKRTKNGKGVTIPSQRRYITYYQTILKEGFIRDPVKKQLTIFRFHTVPDYDPQGGCDPYIKVWENSKEVLTTEILEHKKKEKYVDIDCGGIELEGDIKIVLLDHDLTSDDHMCHFWFNTSYIENNYLLLEKNELDKAVKDVDCKHFKKEFRIELFFNDNHPPPLED